MGKYAITLNTTPENAAELLRNGGFADLLHEDVMIINEDLKIIVLVFEKYFMRVEGRAGITAIIENLGDNTEVRVITAGVGRGMFFKFDWGASDSMINDIKSCLSQYIVGEREME